MHRLSSRLQIFKISKETMDGQNKKKISSFNCITFMAIVGLKSHTSCQESKKIYRLRSDNCIKNHFYCTLRKAFRRINRFISENKNKVRQKEIKNIVLSKIITVAEQRFETKLEVNEEMISTCEKIKNNLVRFSKDLLISEATEANLLIIIADIN